MTPKSVASKCKCCCVVSIRYENSASLKNRFPDSMTKSNKEEKFVLTQNSAPESLFSFFLFIFHFSFYWNFCNSSIIHITQYVQLEIVFPLSVARGSEC